MSQTLRGLGLLGQRGLVGAFKVGWAGCRSWWLGVASTLCKEGISTPGMDRIRFCLEVLWKVYRPSNHWNILAGDNFIDYVHSNSQVTPEVIAYIKYFVVFPSSSVEQTSMVCKQFYRPEDTSAFLCNNQYVFRPPS